MDLAVASSPRQRLLLRHRVGPPLVLALKLQLALRLRFPTRVRVVAQACSLLLSCLVVQDFAVE